MRRLQKKKGIETIATFQQRKNFFGTYDALKGVSGELYQLLDSGNQKQHEKELKEMVKFLVMLTGNYNYRGKEVPRYHIRRNYQYNFYERAQMPHGHINMGVAHGVIGPAVAMSKALSLGVEVPGQREAIDTICDWYDKFAKCENGVLQFPRRLRIEDFLKGVGSDYTVNSGWCYGNLGVIRGRMKIAYYLDRKDEYNRFKSEFIKIIGQPIENYNLVAPIICHGYASIVSLQLYAYMESGDANCLHNIERNVCKLRQVHEEWLRENEYYCQDGSFLSGKQGVELTLKNYETYAETYGRILMMD